jgi:hypothetical protein
MNDLHGVFKTNLERFSKWIDAFVNPKSVF